MLLDYFYTYVASERKLLTDFDYKMLYEYIMMKKLLNHISYHIITFSISFY